MWARFFPADPPQFYKVPISCHQIDPIKQMLIDAGFADIDHLGARARTRKYPMSAHFARGAVYGNPLIEQIRARGGVTPEQVYRGHRRGARARLRRSPGAHAAPGDRL